MKLKTKKILMLISSILVFIINLFSVISVLSGVSNLESPNSNIPISNDSQVIFLSLCAIVNLISIFLISRDWLKYKKKIIILNIIQILFGSLFNIILGIFNIILLSTKTKDIEVTEKVKKELPMLEDITKYKWYVYFILFIFLFTICYTPILDFLPTPSNKIFTLISIALLYLIQVSFLLVPMWNEIKRDFIMFKNNFKTYLSNMLPRFGIIIIAYMLTNFSLIIFAGNIPTNQSMISSWPLYISAPLAIIIAPLTEEIMFRGFMRKFLKNNTLFAIISSLVFGCLHVTLANNISQLLFIIPYSILGFAFTLNYIKTKNIASNIFLHSSWNSIAVIALIITKFL